MLHPSPSTAQGQRVAVVLWRMNTDKCYCLPFILRLFYRIYLIPMLISPLQDSLPFCRPLLCSENKSILSNLPPVVPFAFITQETQKLNSPKKCTHRIKYDLGVVVELALLLGLHLHDGVHEVLVHDLGGVSTQCQHALHYSRTTVTRHSPLPHRRPCTGRR